MKIQYITDIEGHKEFLEKQVVNSDVVYVNNGKLEFKDDSGIFVFGGDVCDRGDDIAVIKMLTEFKQAYPERVFLIAGNRDINKTRFLTELPKSANGELKTSADDVVKPSFSRRSYKDFLEDRLDTPVNRLKWILQDTMGAPGAFECRRQELQRITESEDISDEDVYASFRNSIEENGCMREYLESAQLALILGDTLFVHGSINANNINKVPVFSTDNDDLEGHMQLVVSASEWVAELNHWYTQALNHCLANAEADCIHNFSRQVSGAALQEYAAGPGSRFKGQGVVVGNMFAGKNSVLSPVSIEVGRWLVENSLHRIVLGHQPHGQTPGYVVGTEEGVANDGYNNVEFITGDTLYGHHLAYGQGDVSTKIRGTDPRGSSCAQIYIEINLDARLSQAMVVGTDGNDVSYCQELENRSSHRAEQEYDPFIGRVYTDESDNRYLVRVNSNPAEGIYKVSSKELPYSMVYVEKTRAELEEIMQAERFLGVDRRSKLSSGALPAAVLRASEFTESVQQQAQDDTLSDPTVSISSL